MQKQGMDLNYRRVISAGALDWLAIKPNAIAAQ
jgi:hypothetical protein